MNNLDIIKSSLNLFDVVRFYRFLPNSKGFIKCPFHNEKTESLKIYNSNKGYFCYGCGNGGTVIDFTMKLFNINIGQAIIRLSNDFNLKLTNDKPNLRQIERLQKERREKEEQEKKKKDKYFSKLSEFRKYHFQYLENVPKEKFEELSEKCIEAIMKMNEIDIWLEKNKY